MFQRVLDILIEKNELEFVTSVYPKPNFTRKTEILVYIELQRVSF